MERKGKTKNIGIEVKIPKEKCNDKHCPFHGNLKLRGRIFVGTVIKTSTSKTAKIEFPYLVNLPKYERYEKRRTRLQVHVPPCIKVNIGDRVKVMECRPISKTKNFVVIENESTKS